MNSLTGFELKRDDFDNTGCFINDDLPGKGDKNPDSQFYNNDEFRNLLEREWENVLKNEERKADMNHILDRIHHIISKNENKADQKPYLQILRIYMKVAAVLFIPLLLAGYFHMTPGGDFFSQTTGNASSKIYAPLGSRVSFILPDGTTGMLNSGSVLSYSLPFDIRKVNLEGEAWFDVAKDTRHPFEITAGNSTINVTGTSFNLSAYPSENYVEIVMHEGKLNFRDMSGNIETILPAERLVFQSGTSNKSVVDPDKYNAWTEGKLVFRGDPMSEVARRIERWYNVKVNIADEELNNYSFRATFEDDSLEDVLKFISMTSPIRFKITPRELLVDGTFNKAVVTIYKIN